MGKLFLIAFRNLLQHKRRTFMLGGAIAGVTALLVAVLALTNGVRETMLESATTLMTGHVNVAGFYKVTSGQSAPVVTDAKKVAEIVRLEVPEAAWVSNRGRGWARLVSDTASMQLGIAGIDIATEPGFREVVQVKEGNLDDLSKPNGLLLFEKQAEKLEVKVGDTLTFSAPSPRGVNNTLDVQVVVIARDVGLLSSFNSFLNNEGLRNLYQLNDDTTGALHIYLKDMSQVNTVKERLRAVFAKEGFELMAEDPRSFWMKFETVNREAWVGQRLDISTWEAEISFIQWTLMALNALSFLLIFVLMVIISVGIMNTLWIAIRERTREIGTLRAIGMQKNRVLAMFVIEGFTLGLMGTLAGVIVGLAACFGVNAAAISVPLGVQMFVMSDTLKLAASPGGIVFAVLLITGSTTFISLFPSFLAARMKPITAMHHIG
ncbi:MAG: FtsX-like permease family protein [Myxococcaceae bacterium]